MKTKPAMQELIERLKSLQSKGYNDAGIRTGIEIATQLLPKSKQEIIDAWNEGANGVMKTKTATDYFTQKYEQ